MIKDLEEAIGYRFRNITLLQNALTHSSYANERWHDSLKSNELIGRAILSHTIGGLCAGVAANWIFTLLSLI